MRNAPNEFSLDRNPLSFDYLSTTSAEVYDIIYRLKTNKAAGIDCLQASLLKVCARCAVRSLARLFNSKCKLAEQQREWKTVIFTPVFQTGGKSIRTNYRSVPLLPILTKGMEHVARKKLPSFVSPWINFQQSGFQKDDRTVPQICRLSQRWSEAVDQSSFVGLLFFNLQKAFRMVLLSASGLIGPALNWTKSFLCL